MDTKTAPAELQYVAGKEAAAINGQPLFKHIIAANRLRLFGRVLAKAPRVLYALLQNSNDDDKSWYNLIQSDIQWVHQTLQQDWDGDVDKLSQGIVSAPKQWKR